MLPSTTMKFFMLLDFTPVTGATKILVLPMIERPGSKIRVKSYRFAKLALIESTKSRGDGTPFLKDSPSTCAEKPGGTFFS
jgi:hypothetical protein